MWINLYNIDPIKPIGIIAAESLELDRATNYYGNKKDYAIGVLQLPSRRQVYSGTKIFAETDEVNAIGTVLKSYYSPKYNTAMVYAEIDKNYIKLTNFNIKDENISIKAEIIHFFDLT